MDKPIYVPSRLPYWDTGWDDNYETNEFFENGNIIPHSKEDPIILKIPLRKIYNIGHRGAPHHYPENTIASFKKAVELGANGLEFDLCLCKDKRIAVFHDAKPIKFPNQMDRTIFEDLPYELCSPEFEDNGRYILLKKFNNGNYLVGERLKVNSSNEYDLINITFTKLNKIYKYHHVNGVEHQIPDLGEFLQFISSEKDKLDLIFFDVKAPDWDEKKDVKKYLNYGKLIGESLKRFNQLPKKLIICNPSITVLEYLKHSIKATGEDRCEFAFDAAGSLSAFLGSKSDPLHIARVMDNCVVSIGSLFRPGSVEEIAEAARDRDYNYKSNINTVIHWTLNDPSQMYFSLLAGVNGILTDKPEVLKDVLRKLKINLG